MRRDERVVLHNTLPTLTMQPIQEGDEFQREREECRSEFLVRVCILTFVFSASVLRHSSVGHAFSLHASARAHSLEKTKTCARMHRRDRVTISQAQEKDDDDAIALQKRIAAERGADRVGK